MQPWQPQQHDSAWKEPAALPGALPTATTEDHDLRALSPFWPKVAAAMIAVAGLCGVLGSLQTWWTVEIEDEIWNVVPVLDLLIGIACIVVATKLASARRWAAITGLVLASLLVVSSGGWCVYAVSNRLLAVFIIVAPLVAFAGVVLAAVSIVPCDRAERARDRLKSQGLELGL